jgi:hypothetical protein
VLASVTVSGPSYRLEGEPMRKTAILTREAADEISRRLGTDQEMTAAFHLHQGMGGGKSHALVGLYHMASDPHAFFSTDLGKDVLTEAEERIARFWEGGDGTPLPPGIWNQVALRYVARANLTVPQQSKVFATINVAMADAGVAAWDTKYAYWNPRPINAIRDLGMDPDWEPLLDTPFFPAYISGHAAYSGAVGEVMAYLFPDDADLFREKAEEAAWSRVLGGIHYPMDGEEGLKVGRAIGRLVVRWLEDAADE